VTTNDHQSVIDSAELIYLSARFALAAVDSRGERGENWKRGRWH
jgi:hypothetical protein